MHSLGLKQIGCQVVTGISQPLSVELLTPETVRDLLHLLVLERLPEIVRDVEHDSLEEEHEGDPLIVGVHLPVSFIISLWTNSLMGSCLSIYAFILSCNEGRC